jgi:hypothetical protein
MDMIANTTALAGPALRLHLLELFLAESDMPDQALPMAQAAEAWITGDESVPDMPRHGHLLLDEEVHQAKEDGVDQPEQAAAVVAQPDAGDAPAPVSRGDKKASLIACFSEGLETREICERLGMPAGTVTGCAAKYGWSAAWREARERRRATPVAAPQAPAVEEAEAPAAPASAPVIAPKPQPASEQALVRDLPEDRLRRMPAPVDAPADMEAVETWLRNNGSKLVVEAPGLYFCDGAMLTATELVKRANKARKALHLPPFTVRKS